MSTTEGSDVQVVSHFADPDGTGTDHLVAEDLGNDNYRTECGQEFYVGRFNDTFVGSIDTVNTTEFSRCGNCPWGDVDV